MKLLSYTDSQHLEPIRAIRIQVYLAIDYLTVIRLSLSSAANRCGVKYLKCWNREVPFRPDLLLQYFSPQPPPPLVAATSTPPTIANQRKCLCHLTASRRSSLWACRQWRTTRMTTSTVKMIGHCLIPFSLRTPPLLHLRHKNWILTLDSILSPLLSPATLTCILSQIQFSMGPLK